MYKAKKLPFLYYQLEPIISTKTNAYHYEKHYKTYLNNLNKIIIKNNISTNYELIDLYNHLDIIKDEDKNDFLYIRKVRLDYCWKKSGFIKLNPPRKD